MADNPSLGDDRFGCRKQRRVIFPRSFIEWPFHLHQHDIVEADPANNDSCDQEANAMGWDCCGIHRLATDL